MNTQDWRRLQDLADQLEEAWKNAEEVALDPFLPPPGDALRPTVLLELIATDLEIRWRKGRGQQLEYYLQRFPELGPAAELPPKLIYEEYRVRHRHGDRAPMDSYRQRFPEQFERVLRLTQQDPVVTVGTEQATPAAPPPDAASLPLMGNHILPVGGGYKLEKLIGRGGFGEVWRATAPGGFPAAVKIITRPADHEERLREERSLSVIKALNHHFLIRTIASWSEQDRLFIVMDLADCSLRDRLKQCKARQLPGIPVEDLLPYFRESAEALDYLHGQDVLHRDIKPDNILLVGQHVRLADFGLARHQEQLLASVSGSGTPAYMAPEVWRGKASKHSDQYSLAYTYAELRLGHRAFASTDYAGVMFDHLDSVPKLDPLPQAEQQALLRALAKKPEERYPTCLEFVHALEQAVGVSQPATAAGTQANPGGPTMQRPVAPPPTQGNAGPSTDSLENTSAPPGDGEDFRSLLPNRPPATADHTAPVPIVPATGHGGKHRRWLPFAVVAGLFVAVLGGLVALIWVSTTGSFTVDDPPPLTLRPGESQTITLTVHREHFHEPIRLTFQTALPITISGTEIPADAGSVEIKISVDGDAPRGSDTIRILEDAGKVHRQNNWQVRIELPAARPWLPEHFKPAPDSPLVTDLDRREFYKRILAELPGLPPVPFVLVPRTNAADPPSFYLMETKVWNALRAALGTRAGLAAGRWPGAGEAATLPAFGMTAEEAHHMAHELGGSLPTKEQWDKAAGFAEPGRPEFVGGGEPAVNRRKQGPRPVTKSGKDASLSGVHDLAGNGTEFTRSLTAETEATRKLVEGQSVPLSLKPLPAGVLVILRGKRHTAAERLRFADLAEQQKTPQTQFYDAASPFNGFRVVFEPK